MNLYLEILKEKEKIILIWVIIVKWESIKKMMNILIFMGKK